MTKTHLLATLLSLSFISFASAQEQPMYDPETKTLAIPIVSGEGLPGAIQNSVLEHTEGDNWKLVDSWEATLVRYITGVNLVSVGNAPTSYYLEIFGQTSGCDRVGRAVQQHQGNTLNISLYLEYFDYFPDGEMILCLTMMNSFRKVIPLDVYGLPAGEYEYHLNGDLVGSLTLQEDNVLLPPEDYTPYPTMVFEVLPD